jgi:P-type conjugative transfer protein TrbJ
MMRALLVALCFCIAATPASAQSAAATYGVPNTPPLTQSNAPLPVLNVPSVVCPTNPLGNGWNFCNSIQQWNQMYTEFTKAYNEVVEMQRNVDRYAQYPQKLQAYVQTDIGQVEKVMNQVQGLSFEDTQLQGTVSRLFPNYVQGENYQAYVNQLSNATNTSLINAVKVAGIEVQTQPRDADAVDVVKDAIGRATSPTQAVQALAQLEAVLIEQIQKQQRLSAGSIQSASSYYLTEIMRKQNANQAEAASLAAFQQNMDVTFGPPLTKAQAAGLATSAAGPGTTK